MLPRLAAGDSPATRPLISLIVPVWNDDELVVDLVSGLQVASELGEWVVAAVRPGQPLCELHRRGISPADFLRQTLARQTNERRGRQSARIAAVLSPRRFRVASRAPERFGKNRKKRCDRGRRIPSALRRSASL